MNSHFESAFCPCAEIGEGGSIACNEAWKKMAIALEEVEFLNLAAEPEGPGFVSVFTNAGKKSFRVLRLRGSESTVLLLIPADDRENQARRMYSAVLGALREVFSGFAHEVNNPLTIILGKVDAIRRNAVGIEEKLAADLERIAVAARRIHQSVKSVRALFEESEFDGAPVSAESVLEMVLGFTGARIQQRGIELKREGKVEAMLAMTPARAARALLSLVQNAIDAQAGVESPWIGIRVEESGGMVHFRVSNGGKSPENPAFIGEPFYTTKKNAPGIGVFMARDFAEKNGGSLVLSKEREFSATLSLPVAKAK